VFALFIFIVHLVVNLILEGLSTYSWFSFFLLLLLLFFFFFFFNEYIFLGYSLTQKAIGVIIPLCGSILSLYGCDIFESQPSIYLPKISFSWEIGSAEKS
jgi:hypothetical protein